MEYLTTHDLVWINTTITGKPLRYNYVTLEATMAAQYSYGESQDAVGQAAGLLEYLLFKPPFEYGNRRTAFIAVLTFLNANGFATKASDAVAAQAILDVGQRKIGPLDAIESLAAPTEGALPVGITLRKLIAHECNLHVEALQALAAGD